MAGYGWQDAQLLRPGDRLLEPDQSLVTVISSVREEHPDGLTVYNFEVAGLHDYFVSATATDSLVLSHNMCSKASAPSSTATRRIQTIGDADFASQAAARREAMRRFDIQTSKPNNFKLEVDPKSYKNPNLRGPNGEPSEILKAKDLNGNDIEILHHKWGHQFKDNNTFELPHFQGPNGEHLSYPR